MEIHDSEDLVHVPFQNCFCESFVRWDNGMAESMKAYVDLCDPVSLG